MKISHSAIVSPIYEMAKVVEVDIRLGDHSWTARIELLRDTEQPTRFRCHVWESELFRLIPTFPRDENDQPAHISDDFLMVERGIARCRVAYPREDIVASDVEAALVMVLDDLEAFLAHATGEKPIDVCLAILACYPVGG